MLLRHRRHRLDPVYRLEDLELFGGFSLILPVYNEAEVLEKTLSDVRALLSEAPFPVEILIGDDGSSDASPQIAQAFAAKHPQMVRCFANPRNRGRGSILSQGFSIMQHDVGAYLDADLEIGLPFLVELMARMQDPKVEVCTGSKLTLSQPRARAPHRKLASRGYNFMARLILNSPVSDHQCGLKGFRRSCIQALLPDVREDGWAWDTEVLLLAQKQGHLIHEFQVDLIHQRTSKVPYFRTISMFFRKLLGFYGRGLRLKH